MSPPKAHKLTATNSRDMEVDEMSDTEINKMYKSLKII